MSHKLYTQTGSAAQKALKHRPADDDAGSSMETVDVRRRVQRIGFWWVWRLHEEEETQTAESGWRDSKGHHRWTATIQGDGYSCKASGDLLTERLTATRSLQERTCIIWLSNMEGCINRFIHVDTNGSTSKGKRLLRISSRQTWRQRNESSLLSIKWWGLNGSWTVSRPVELYLGISIASSNNRTRKRSDLYRNLWTVIKQFHQGKKRWSMEGEDCKKAA